MAYAVPQSYEHGHCITRDSCGWFGLTDRKAYIRLWKSLHRDSLRASWRRHTEKNRIKVLTHYGGRCSCCGYSDLTKKIRGFGYLQIDFINGGHRRTGKHGSVLYRWIIKQNFPLYLRVLCAGCNAAIEYRAEKCELHRWENGIARTPN